MNENMQSQILQQQRQSKILQQQQALLDAIEFMDKGDAAVAPETISIVGDLVRRMVESIPNISDQRKHIKWLIGDIQKLINTPAEEEWQPSLDVIDSLREDVERERARGPSIIGPQVLPGRRLFEISRQPLPVIPPSLLSSITTPDDGRKEE